MIVGTPTFPFKYRYLVVKVLIHIWMLSIFSTPVFIRHLCQLKTVVFLLCIGVYSVLFYLNTGQSISLSILWVVLTICGLNLWIKTWMLFIKEKKCIWEVAEYQIFSYFCIKPYWLHSCDKLTMFIIFLTNMPFHLEWVIFSHSSLVQ
jgi:hypothetical protein